jgi:hypothetical protein
MWKTIPRPGRWKRLDSAARAFYPSFQFIPTSRQLRAIATHIQSLAALDWAAGELSVIYYRAVPDKRKIVIGDPEPSTVNRRSTEDEYEND